MGALEGQYHRGSGHSVSEGCPGGCLYSPYTQSRDQGDSGFASSRQCHVPAPCVGSAHTVSTTSVLPTHRVPRPVCSGLWAGSICGTACADTAQTGLCSLCLQHCLHKHSSNSTHVMLPWQMWALPGQCRCCWGVGSAAVPRAGCVFSAAWHALAVCSGWKQLHAQCTACVGSVLATYPLQHTQAVCRQAALPICLMRGEQAACRQGTQQCLGSVHSTVHWQCAWCSVGTQPPGCVHGAAAS